jgi:hypothetical protein
MLGQRGTASKTPSSFDVVYISEKSNQTKPSQSKSDLVQKEYNVGKCMKIVRI